MTYYVVFPQNKIISCIFKISNVLMVGVFKANFKKAEKQL
jgi:hypothetical protein